MSYSPGSITVSGTEMATFYVDPYKRSKDKYAGAWINTGREKSDSFAGKPISFLNLNLIPSLGKQPSLMSVKDVALLFSMVSKNFIAVGEQNTLQTKVLSWYL